MSLHFDIWVIGMLISANVILSVIYIDSLDPSLHMVVSCGIKVQARLTWCPVWRKCVWCVCLAQFSGFCGDKRIEGQIKNRIVGFVNGMLRSAIKVYACLLEWLWLGIPSQFVSDIHSKKSIGKFTLLKREWSAIMISLWVSVEMHSRMLRLTLQEPYMTFPKNFP